jgi:hypothetical protein
MPTASNNHDAHDYTKRIREQLPSPLLKLQEVLGLINYPQ